MTKYLAPLFFLVLLAISCSTPKQISGSPEKQKTKVFLFAGQSNMDGRANGAQLSPKDLERLEKVSGRITFYYNHKKPTPLQLTIPAPHTQRKFNLTTSFGPELFFGIELAEQYPDQKFIFIKRAKGGTSLYGCWNPFWTMEKATLMGEAEQPKLFSDFISYTQEVLGLYDKTEYELSGMFWVQGESDSGVRKRGPLPSSTYGDNLSKLIAETRSQLAAPNLPFIMFQVGSGKVVQGMRKTAGADEAVYMVPQSSDEASPDYYAKNPPPIGHYITPSMKRIGGAFFYVMESANPPSSIR
jgi:hypothetical protein